MTIEQVAGVDPHHVGQDDDGDRSVHRSDGVIGDNRAEDRGTDGAMDGDDDGGHDGYVGADEDGGRDLGDLGDLDDPDDAGWPVDEDWSVTTWAELPGAGSQPGGLDVEFVLEPGHDRTLLALAHTRGLRDLGLPELYLRPPTGVTNGGGSSTARLAALVGRALVQLGLRLLVADGLDVPPYRSEDGTLFWLGQPHAPTSRLAVAFGDDAEAVVPVECSLWRRPPAAETVADTSGAGPRTEEPPAAGEVGGSDGD